MTEEYKCKDCKWLTGKKNIRGIECMHPKNQEKWNKAKTLWMGELRKDTARYKQRNAPACRKFEAKENEEAPSIDIEPKRGEWIDMGDFEQCSVCKGTHLKEFQSYYGKTTWIKTPYCPNCGADMRERKESE